MLAGLIEPTEGSVSKATDHLQYIGHEAAVKAELSVRENLQFSARLSDGGESVDSVIDKLGLGDCEEQTGRTLSAGQRKRTALARLMLTNADLWLLDEPYANLDADAVELLDGLLDRHLESGGACVMTTHGSHRPVPSGQLSNWRCREMTLAAQDRAA